MRFELLPKGDRKLELDEGVIVEVEIALAEHELVKLKLTTLLARALPESGFEVGCEVECRLGDRVTLVPDLAIWRESDLERMDPSRTIVGGPLIAIEIVSSESAADLDKKIRQYFAAGTQVAWVIYPKSRAIEVKRPNGSINLDTGDVLEAPELVPGLKIHVSEIFATLNKASASHTTPR